VLEHRRVRLGTGDFFGELALLTGRVRQADIVALSYCQLLVLRKTEFDRFLKENPSVRDEINRVAEARLAANLDATERTASSAAGE
jgi:monovalent cation:H+ antiporter, CPA1 family